MLLLHNGTSEFGHQQVRACHITILIIINHVHLGVWQVHPLLWQSAYTILETCRTLSRCGACLSRDWQDQWMLRRSKGWKALDLVFRVSTTAWITFDLQPPKLTPTTPHQLRSFLRSVKALEAAIEILEKQYELCELVRLETEPLKKDDAALSEMAKNELPVFIFSVWGWKLFGLGMVYIPKTMLHAPMKDAMALI